MTLAMISWLGDSVSEIVINLGTYFLFGAAIVISIWIILRIINGNRR